MNGTYEESTEGTEMYFISFYSNSVKLKDMQKTQVQLSTKLKRKLLSAISDIEEIPILFLAKQNGL